MNYEDTTLCDMADRKLRVQVKLNFFELILKGLAWENTEYSQVLTA